MLLDGFGYAVLDFAPEGAPSKSHTAGGVFSRASWLDEERLPLHNMMQKMCVQRSRITDAHQTRKQVFKPSDLK